MLATNVILMNDLEYTMTGSEGEDYYSVMHRLADKLFLLEKDGLGKTEYFKSVLYKYNQVITKIKNLRGRHGKRNFDLDPNEE